MKQTRVRIFRGDTRAEGKILSLFEPSTEIIRKGKAVVGQAKRFSKEIAAGVKRASPRAFYGTSGRAA